MEIRVKSLKDLTGLLGKTPLRGGAVLDPPLLVFVEELGPQPILSYTTAPKSICETLKVASLNAPTSTSTRASGLLNTRTVYGPQPRIEIRANCRACRFTKATFQDTAGFGAFGNALLWAAGEYSKFFPEHFENAVKEVEEKVHVDWRWNSSPWLSINCNFNQAIKYHLDSGNMPGALSSVLIISENIEGGELHLPQLDVSLSQKSGSLCLLRGDKIIHGVRPFRQTEPKGFRASIVFYTLENMKVCGSFKEELKHANFLECSKAKVRFTAKHKLETLRKAKSFFSESDFKKHEAKWLAKVAEEEKNKT